MDTLSTNHIIQETIEILTSGESPIWFTLFFILLFFSLAIYVSINVILPMKNRLVNQKTKLKQKNLRLNSHFAILNPSPLFTIKSMDLIEAINESAIKLIEHNPKVLEEIKSVISKREINLLNIINQNELYSFSELIDERYYTIFLRGDSILNYAQLYLNDVSDLKNTQLELAESKRQLQQLTRYNLAKIEEERKKIAMELHDTVGNDLALLGLSINVQNANNKKEELENVNKLLGNITKEIKEISYSLNPSALQRHGIALAINSVIKQFNKVQHIQGELNISGELLRYDESFEINIFRVVQEAISNILKHSEATNYKVELKFFPEKFELTIEDNGRGLQMEKVKSKNENHMGLLNMEERIKNFGGSFNIESKLNEGTTIKIDVDSIGITNA